MAVEQRKRGPKPTLTAAVIAEAAVALADAEGIEAVTMQRLGAVFGFTPMSLYRYVSSKDELIAAMIERAVGEPPSANDELPWRSGLEQWARGIAECFDLHPWTLAATGRLRVMGPNEIAWMDRALGLLAAAGLSPARQHGAFLVLIGHVRAVAQFSVRAPSVGSGVTLAQWRVAARYAAGDELPSLRGALERGAFDARASGLARGLEIVIAGIAALGLQTEHEGM